ncbi:hypothetical protein SAMN05444724_1515 [Salinivibrio sp. ES.052]|nr:hypothetical protein SAMN05444724_1515 [Salinivibrio sp. ES.052]
MQSSVYLYFSGSILTSEALFGLAEVNIPQQYI